jgi:hypothetical protein
VKRLETQPGALAAQERTIVELRKALEAAGIEFIAENGGGPGVRLRKPPIPNQPKKNRPKKLMMGGRTHR